MMLNINEFVAFKQKDINTFMFTIDSENFLNSTTVIYYNDKDREKAGYQRQLSDTHYKKIAKYLLTDNQSILPTAIIGAISPDSIEICEDELRIIDDIRIVDGQHRREAVNYIKERNPEDYDKMVKNMKFPVLLMIIDKDNLNEYIVEVQTFVNINKKGRKVSTDLAKSLESRITEKIINSNGFGSKSQAITYISNYVIEKLNEDVESCWYKGIKTGGGNDQGRPISKNAFMNSLEVFISNYISINHQDKDYIKSWLKETATEIYSIIKNIWEILSDRWSECFYWDDSEENSEYDKDYSIQKGIGVYPLHHILEGLEYDKKDEIINKFDSIIKSSKVISEDWVRGGLFSGFNSSSGFKKIEKAILDEKYYSRLSKNEDEE